AFEQLGHPLDPADFRPPPQAPDGPWPRGAEATARLTNLTMRVSNGTGVRTLLPATAVEEFVLAAAAVPGLPAAKAAVFDRIKNEMDRTYEASRTVSRSGPLEYLPVQVDPVQWFRQDAPGWTHFTFTSGDDAPTPDPTTPQWQFQLADPLLQP